MALKPTLSVLKNPSEKLDTSFEFWRDVISENAKQSSSFLTRLFDVDFRFAAFYFAGAEHA